MAHVLIAEDDTELALLFRHVLEKNGYAVTVVSDGEGAEAAIESSFYDLLISDVMMPKKDGFSLVRSLREKGNTMPVLTVTAKAEFEDMRQGFAFGTDDYMIKPVNVGELVIRVGALLRRAQMANERKLTIGGTVLDMDSLTVTTQKESMVLPQKEFMLLYKMASYPGKIFTRKEMMEEIWGYDTPTDTHTVDVHVGRLRERFRDSEDFEIVTIRGIGYKAVRK